MTHITSMKASSVIASEPAGLSSMLASAQPKRPSCIRYTTSSEKVEKVVRPPQNPVVISNFGGVQMRHAGENRHRRADDKTADQIDHQRTERNVGVQRIHFHAYRPAQNAADAAADKYGQ